MRELTENYCFHCKSYTGFTNDEGVVQEYCTRRRGIFKCGSIKVKCSTFRPLEETCDICNKSIDITDFYMTGSNLICSEECYARILKALKE